MQQRCEVCESFRPHGDLKPGRELLELSFGERTVVLCRGHAGIAQNSQATSFEALRALYAESTGRRSYVARRAREGDSTGRTPRAAGRRADD